MSEQPTGALTRFRPHVDEDGSYLGMITSGSGGWVLFEHAEDLRHVLAQQVQEVEIVRHGRDLAWADRDDLAKQLAAMTTERDYYKADYERCEEVIASLEQQLAASQARCRELEAELESHAWTITPAMAQAKIDQLHVTLAAREQRISDLEFKVRETVGIYQARIDERKAQLDAAAHDAERLRMTLQAILDADERGQGLPFKEAMDHAYKLLKEFT